jgi:hypothetical protein
MRSKKKADTACVPRSISFPPGMLKWIDEQRGEERSAFALEAVERVLGSAAVRFIPSRARVALLTRFAAEVRKGEKYGMPDKETWTISRSLSFPGDLLAAIDDHRARLGMERSRYVIACLEHVHGIRPHPELFEPSMRP